MASSILRSPHEGSERRVLQRRGSRLDGRRRKRRLDLSLDVKVVPAVRPPDGEGKKVALTDFARRSRELVLQGGADRERPPPRRAGRSGPAPTSRGWRSPLHAAARASICARALPGRWPGFLEMGA